VASAAGTNERMPPLQRVPERWIRRPFGARLRLQSLLRWLTPRICLAPKARLDSNLRIAVNSLQRSGRASPRVRLSLSGEERGRKSGGRRAAGGPKSSHAPEPAWRWSKGFAADSTRSAASRLPSLRPKPFASASFPAQGNTRRSLLSFTHGGPATNNHAEHSLRPLVIFRKVCLGTRSPTGSDNVAIFASLFQTAALQGASVIEMFRALFRSSPTPAHGIIFAARSNLAPAS
jgi:hypothetical protein